MGLPEEPYHGKFGRFLPAFDIGNLLSIFGMQGIYMYAMGNAECFNKENLTVTAGTYNSYAITVTRGLEYYYSPEVGNIVKFSMETPSGLIANGELISTNYGL